MIYLDYNATAPLLPAVAKVMEAVAHLPMNPGSAHAAGRHAKKLLEESRASIAAAVGAFANEVLFVSSGSEANNMVLRGFAGERPLLVGATEHASILATAKLLGGGIIPVHPNGLIDLEILDTMLGALGRTSLQGGGKSTGALVSIQLANNETGVIQPIAEIAQIVHAHGGLLHCDAVQALGKITIDWGLLGVDMLTLCAHKAGGPVGVGALLIRNDLPIKPLLTGGKQELGRRAGTENVPGIVGFAELVKQVVHCPDAKKWSAWRDWLATELTSCCPSAVVFGASQVPPPVGGRLGGGQSEAQPLPITAPPQPSPYGGGSFRLPNTLHIAMPGVSSETQLMHFDLAGFCVSSGSACSSGKMSPSHVLLAMGVPMETVNSAIRISFGWATTEADVKAFAECWKAASVKLAKKVA